MIRTRIAPSPTGENLHIGNLYTGFINFAFARKHKGKFLIRIEDTDRERFVKGGEEKILSSLKLLHLNYDEGPDIGGPYAPYRQSERLKLYHKYAQELVDKNHAEFAYYPKEQAGKKKDYSQKEALKTTVSDTVGEPPKNITEMLRRKDWVVRMIIPRDRKVIVHDLIRGDIEFDSNELSKQVLIKSDGYPTYHLGVVVDDHLMEISHVIRAEEWISSTPKHILLYEAFGWELPVFAHVPILRNPDHSKLSKRKNPVWVSWYLEEGFLPEAILNFVALLGWSFPDEREIFSLEEFVQAFDLKDVKPVGPVFDLKKLEWMNGEYIRKSQILNLKYQIKEFLKMKKLTVQDEFIDKFLPLTQTRMKTLKDFYELVSPFIQKRTIELTPQEKNIVKILAQKLAEIGDWNEDVVLSEIKKVLKENKCNMKTAYKIFTGRESGLPLPQTLVLLGKEKSLEILQSLTSA